MVVFEKSLHSVKVEVHFWVHLHLTISSCGHPHRGCNSAPQGAHLSTSAPQYIYTLIALCTHVYVKSHSPPLCTIKIPLGITLIEQLLSRKSQCNVSLYFIKVKLLSYLRKQLSVSKLVTIFILCVFVRLTVCHVFNPCQKKKHA